MAAAPQSFIDPGLAALPSSTISALRTLAAKSDRTRDLVGGLLQSIQLDPLGDRSRGSLLTWPQFLEQYNSALAQLSDLTGYLSDPLTDSARNPFAHTFVHASRPPLTHAIAAADGQTLAPEYNPHKTLLKTYAHPAYETQRSELLSSFEDPASSASSSSQPRKKGWRAQSSEDVDILEPDEQDELYDSVRRVVNARRKKVKRARVVLAELKDGFDWRLRLGHDEEDGEEEGDDDDEGEAMQDETATRTQSRPRTAGASTSLRDTQPAGAPHRATAQSQSTPRATATDPGPKANAGRPPSDVINISDDDDDDDGLFGDGSSHAPTPTSTAGAAGGVAAASQPGRPGSVAPSETHVSTPGAEDDDEDEEMEEFVA